MDNNEIPMHAIMMYGALAYAPIHADVLGPTAFKPVKSDIAGNIDVSPGVLGCTTSLVPRLSMRTNESFSMCTR